MKLYAWSLHRGAAVLALVFIFNTAGVAWGVYQTLWWWDILNHFLGGVSIGLFTVALLARFPNIHNRYWLWWFSIVAIVFVGWEIYEQIVYTATRSFPFDSIDTLHDIVNDTLGALLALQWIHEFYGGESPD